MLTWWMTEENFHQVIDHFLVCVSVWSRKLAYWLQRLAPRKEGASQYVNGRNGGIKRELSRERWIEVDMAWHEHIYEMSAIRF